MPNTAAVQAVSRSLPETIVAGQPITALAPMQDVTTLPFMTVVAECGPPDWFFTEYFRVHPQSRLEKHILESIVENRTGRPVFAQLIGEDEFHMTRAVRDLLQREGVAGIDLNMGCPAPKVYRKNVGGGLLRDPQKVDSLLGALRDAVPGLFTVKMRIGFEDARHFEALLQLINKHSVDLLSLHARTVKEMYRSKVHYEFIKQAAATVRCPVLANGDVTSAKKARWILDYTGADGVMIGRHAIRNPWIFKQIREYEAGQPVSRVTLGEVYRYIERLYGVLEKPDLPERNQVNAMKKFINFVGQGVDPQGQFLHEARRAKGKQELFAICRRHLLSRESEYFADEPYAGLKARPNRE